MKGGGLLSKAGEHRKDEVSTPFTKRMNVTASKDNPYTWLIEAKRRSKVVNWTSENFDVETTLSFDDYLYLLHLATLGCAKEPL
jgi:hypothetical protein